MRAPATTHNGDNAPKMRGVTSKVESGRYSLPRTDRHKRQLNRPTVMGAAAPRGFEHTNHSRCHTSMHACTSPHTDPDFSSETSDVTGSPAREPSEARATTRMKGHSAAMPPCKLPMRTQLAKASSRHGPVKINQRKTCNPTNANQERCRKKKRPDERTSTSCEEGKVS